MVLRLKTRESRSLPGCSLCNESRFNRKIFSKRNRSALPNQKGRAIKRPFMHSINPGKSSPVPAQTIKIRAKDKNRPAKSGPVVGKITDERSTRDFAKAKLGGICRRQNQRYFGKGQKTGRDFSFAKLGGICRRQNLVTRGGAAPPSRRAHRARERANKNDGNSTGPSEKKYPTNAQHYAGWSSPVARQAHNLKAAGSNPAPATKSITTERHSNTATASLRADAQQIYPLPRRCADPSPRQAFLQVLNNLD